MKEWINYAYTWHIIYKHSNVEFYFIHKKFTIVSLFLHFYYGMLTLSN